MTEMFTITAIVWMLVVTCDLADAPTRRRWLTFGLLIGLAGLLRQVALLPVPLLCAWILWCNRSRRTLQGIATAAVFSLLVMLPATLRNWQVFDRFVLVNTNAGYAFLWANHTIHGDDFMDILPADGPTYQSLIPDEILASDEAALNDALMARGWTFVLDDPARFLRLSLSRVDDYFRFWPSPESSTISNISRVASFGLMLPFMLAGLWQSRRCWRACMPLYLFAIAYTGIHLLSWALVRYRLPVDAILLVFAGLSIARVVAWWPLRPTGRMFRAT